MNIRLPRIEVVQGLDVSYVHIENIGSMSVKKAIELAALIVFMADGTLINESKDGKATKWNTNSPFFKQYEMYVLGEIP